MTGVACPTPILQFFGNNGALLVNGSVLTQVGGVNATVYADVNLSVALPNPIPLNNRGEPSTAGGASVQVFLPPNTAYTFTLFDANSNQVNQSTYVNGVQVNQVTIGTELWPQSAAESAASVTPTYYYYPWGDVRRYGADQTGGADSTSALQQANAQRKNNGAAVYLPGGTYKYTPSSVLEIDDWHGDAGGSFNPTIIKVYAAAGSYSGTVFRWTGENVMSNIFFQEATSSKVYPAIMLQDAAAGLSGLTAYGSLDNIFIANGAIGLDIQQVFSQTFNNLNVQNCGIGINATPTGYFNTLLFNNVFVNACNQCCNFNPTVISQNVTFVGGVIQDPNNGGSASVFGGISGLYFLNTYVEQVNSGSPVTTAFSFGGANGINGLDAAFKVNSGQCDILINGNVQGTIRGFGGGGSHLLTSGAAAQNLTLIDCSLPASGNAAVSNFTGTLTLQNTSYNGATFQLKQLSSGAQKPPTTFGGAPTIASSGTISPTTPVAFISGAAAINAISPPGVLATQGGYIDLIPATGATWTLVTGGSPNGIALASTAVVGKINRLYFDAVAGLWYPSY